VVVGAGGEPGQDCELRRTPTPHQGGGSGSGRQVWQAAGGRNSRVVMGRVAAGVRGWLHGRWCPRQEPKHVGRGSGRGGSERAGKARRRRVVGVVVACRAVGQAAGKGGTRGGVVAGGQWQAVQN